MKDLSELELPPAPTEEVNFDVYQNYELKALRRDELKSALWIMALNNYPMAGTPVHQFEALGFKLSLPKTEEYFERFLMLPMNFAISVNEAEYIVQKIRDFYDRK